MKVELSRTPAIYLGDDCVVPQRKQWNILLTDEDRRALATAAEAIGERSARFPLDQETVRVLARAVEAVQLVGTREE